MFLKLVGMLVITLVGMGGLTSLSDAIPSLQLYIPGSTYNPDTESWLTIEPHFELQVLGASSPQQADYITNLTLYIAMLKNEYGMDGAYVNINGSPVTLNSYGTPPLLPPHGIYPTYYCAYSLPDLLVSTAGETVWNYNPGEEGESDTGDILSLNLDVIGYTFIHFDVAGTVVGKNGKTWERKAPFSHDADSPSVIPEPTSMLLLLPGLLGLVGIRRKKRHLSS